MKTTKNKLISRNIATEQIHLRADGEDGERFIEGYAIVFNQRSKLIREWGEVFYEVIEPGAVDRILADPGQNIIATVDHDRSKMLGRTRSGTLELIKEDRGLKYRIKVPNTSLGNDMAEMIERGDYFESSFIFTIADKGVRYDTSEDIPVRYVSDFDMMRDVAIVIDGAYANTAVTMRSQEWELENAEEPARENSAGALDILQKKIAIHNLKS